MGKTRPNLSAWFRGRIDWHVNGMLARTVSKPFDLQIKGDVTDRLITVTERDGTEWYWEGGHYAASKRNGCYAPLMPKPLKARPPQPLPEGKHGHCKTVGCYNRIQFADTCSRCGERVTVEEDCCT